MFSNYFRIAWRNFVKGKLYSFINVTGLAIGISCAFLIFIYVLHELSYDRFHSNADRIYRVNEFFDGRNGAGERSASIPFPMAEAMEIDFADQVVCAVRLFDFQSPVLTVSYEAAEKTFNERNFYFTDSTYTNVFDLPLLQGNSETALRDANTVVIADKMATRYFGQEPALGKLLRFQGTADLLVTGVYKELPSNTHFHPDFIASFSSLKNFYDGHYPESWHWNPCWTYLLLKEGADPSYLESRLPAFVQKHIPESFVRR